MQSRQAVFLLLVLISWMAVGLPAEGDSTPQWIWEDPAADRTMHVDVSADGDVIAVGTIAGDTGSCVVAAFHGDSAWPILRVEIPSDHGVSSLALSADGTILAFTVEDDLLVYQLPSTFLFSYTGTAENVSWVTLNDNGSLLAAGGGTSGSCVHLFDIPSGQELWSDDINQRLGLDLVLRRMELSDAGDRLLCTLYTAGSGDPIYVALYETQSVQPEIPRWFVQEQAPVTSQGRAYLAGDGQHYIMTVVSSIRYYDLSDPVGDAKTPIWERTGTGIHTLGQSGSISNDGSVVARFNECWEHPFGSPGAVELYEGGSGTLLWFEEEDQYYVGHLSADGSRLACSTHFTRTGVDQSHFVYDLVQQAMIWEAPGFGFMRMSAGGFDYVVGGGRHWGQETIRYPLQYFRIDPNDPPVCQILVPGSGDVVSGQVTISGTFQDPDEPLERVEVLTPEGVQLAELFGGSQGTWALEADLSAGPYGSFTLKARAVDERFKHGAWDEVTVTIDAPPETPTPIPSHTPVPTASPTPTWALSPTPIPPEKLSVGLDLPDRLFLPGDSFWLQLVSRNPEEPLPSTVMVVLLQVGGALYSWPSWQLLEPDGANLDFDVRTIPHGVSRYEIIPPFPWPEGAGERYGLVFLGALVDPTLSELLCVPAFEAWGYTE